MKGWRRYGASALLAATLCTAASAAATPVQMLVEMFRTPVTEWRQQLKDNSRFLDDDFFTNVGKRIRWGIENNHVDDAFRFAIAGDFACEAIDKPGNYRIDLADLFYKAENTTMTGQIVDNIILTSPGTEPAMRAQFLRGRLFENSKDLFNAYLTYKDLADKDWHPADTWLKCGQISLLIGEEKRGLEELARADAAGNAEASRILAQYKARENAGWEQIPPLPNAPGDNTQVNTASPGAVPSPAPSGQQPVAVAPSGERLQMARLATADNRLADAIDLYAQIFTPDDAEISREYAAVLYRAGNLSMAKAIFDQALAKHADDVELLRGRANTLERMYDREGQKANLAAALADYRQASLLDPNHQLLSWELSRAQAKN
jgi:tetratricopeptide (TPR) repeat protein